MKALPAHPGRNMEFPSEVCAFFGNRKPLSDINALMIPPTAPATQTATIITAKVMFMRDFLWGGCD
jgi:hypothetical protein